MAGCNETTDTSNLPVSVFTEETVYNMKYNLKNDNIDYCCHFMNKLWDMEYQKYFYFPLVAQEISS